MATIKTILDLALLVIFYIIIFNIASYWVRKARKYRSKYGSNFSDNFTIRLLSFILVLIITIACSIGIYYTNKFGYCIVANSDKLALYYDAHSFVISVLMAVYLAAGQLIITLSSVFWIIMIIVLFCAIDAFFICPKIKQNEDEKDI